MEENVEKAFGAVTGIKDNKLGPLYKKFNASKDRAEKDTLKEEIKTTREEFQKAKKKAQPQQVVKAYELVCVYFVGKAQIWWGKVVTEMHMKDPWVTVNGLSHKGPRMKTWISLLDCIEPFASSQSSLVMPQSCSATTCNKESRSPSTFQCVPSWRGWAS